MIKYVGHGSAFNHEGIIAEVTLDHLTHTQADHMRQLEAHAKARGILIEPSPEDDIFARSAKIEQLIERFAPPNKGWLRQVNTTVRTQYLRHLLKVKPDALKKLDLAPMGLETRTGAQHNLERRRLRHSMSERGRRLIRHNTVE